MSEGRNVFVCGRTGTGKSFLVKRLIRGLPRVVVYLPKREDAGYAGVYFDGMEPGDYAAFLRLWQTSVDVTGRFHLVYRPGDVFDSVAFDRVAAGVYHCGDCAFVAEDLMSYVGGSINLGSGFKTLLTAGRTRGIECYMLTQRPYKIPREVTSQAREAYIFASHEPADVQYIKEAFGTEAAAKMEALQLYEYVHWIETGETETGKAAL